MTLDSYHNKINEYKELEIQKENLVDVLNYYVLFSNITTLSFFEYDYELNNFIYAYDIDGDKKYMQEIAPKIMDSGYSVIIEDNNTIYGMLTFNEDPGVKDITLKLSNKIQDVLKKIFILKKEFLSQESALDIYIITDEKTLQFANRLNDSLSALLNANISISRTIVSITEHLKEKVKKSILIYTIDDSKLLKLDQDILTSLNEFLIVIGPSD